MGRSRATGTWCSPDNTQRSQHAVSLLHLYGIDQWLDDKGKAMTDKLGSSTGRLQPLEIV